MTKYEYVEAQKKEIKSNIRWSSAGIAARFIVMAPIAYFILLSYEHKDDLTKTLEDKIWFYSPILIEAVILLSIFSTIKRIRKLKKINIEIPSDEEIAEHNLKEDHILQSEKHLDEAEKLKSKVTKHVRDLY